METATEYMTAGGVVIRRETESCPPDSVSGYPALIENRLGGMFTSGVDYPGRYSRWDIAYVDPPIELIARGRDVAVRALNERGRVILPAFAAALGENVSSTGDEQVTAHFEASEGFFSEEERVRRPSAFSAVRGIVRMFQAIEDENLGLYGAFGYDLAFQLDPINLRNPRPDRQRDMVLHLPDQIIVVDRARAEGRIHSYEFVYDGRSTAGVERAHVPTPPIPQCLHLPPQPAEGYYAQIVREATESFARGDLFEVVPSQAFYAACPSPAGFFNRLMQQNPTPYGFFINLGAGEYLVGASPEMYVRVEGNRVETCPISGTIARGADAIEDAANIKSLLESAKDESELTMCTDVDRNDKSRVCEPGSVRVIGRRQIEMYSRLIHTVDHVEGKLLPDCDAIDAFITHMWAVTVTGAPKHWAMQFIEDNEEQPRRWYGGACGMVKFDGSINTGLMLRTAQVDHGVAEVRAGATLLFDSVPEAEEAETRLKASALLHAADAGAPATGTATSQAADKPAEGVRVLLVDHDDSFVHTLADYMRRLGAEVTTVRAGFPVSVIDEVAPDLVVMSPGPGRPSDFGCTELLKTLDERELPVFGVCLGLQAMAEYFGGSLGQLPNPVHGKRSSVKIEGTGLFAGIPGPIGVGRYHSLYAEKASLPPELRVTAVTSDDVVMAIEHATKPVWAVQFHPESIMSLEGEVGSRILANVFRLVREAQTSTARAS